MSESKMAVSESNMAEFKMAAIIKLSQNEQVKFFWCKMDESKMAEFKMDAEFKNGCHHQVDWEGKSKVVLCKWWEPILAIVNAV